MTSVVVVGSINLDLVVPVARLPVPGETVMGGDVNFSHGGKGANQAVAAKRQGVAVSFFGACGVDSFAASVQEEIRDSGVDDSGLVTVDSSPTGVALVVVQQDGENTVTVAPGANDALTPDHLQALPRALGSADVLMLQLEIPLATNLAAARFAREAGVPVVLNAGPLPESPDSLRELLSVVDVLVVNETESEQLAPTAPTTVERATALRRHGVSVVVVTLGADGAVAAYEDSVHEQSGFHVDTVDGTGAGDAFCAALAVALGSAVDVPSAVRRACAAGALATTRLGARAGAPSGEEIERLLVRGEVDTVAR